MLLTLLQSAGAGPPAQTLTQIARYDNVNTFDAATVAASNTLVPVRYDNSNTFYTPVVSAVSTLAPSLYTNTQTFYSATVASSNTLLPALYTNTQTFYSATVTPFENNCGLPIWSSDRS